MHEFIESHGLRLGAHLSHPPSRQPSSVRTPGIILCHGFPVGPSSSENVSRTYPELADRIAAETGWSVLTFSFRGTGRSEGDFSLQGWLDDLGVAIDYMIETLGIQEVWLVGSGTGGSLAIVSGANDMRIKGVAALSPRADFDDWVEHPRRFLEHARDIEVISHSGFPPNVDKWTRELKHIRPLDVVDKLAPRPLLLIQGSDDETVPSTDVRSLADAHGSAELHLISGAGHRLRHDPRAVAVLLAWIERQSPVREQTPISDDPQFFVDDMPE